MAQTQTQQNKIREVFARLRYLHVAPRKVRRVVDMIRGLSAQEAEAQLMLSPRRPSLHVLKLLRSALANARQRDLKISQLYVKTITVDGGPRLKRWIPRARGSVNTIEKKMSHVTLVLGEREKIVAERFVMPRIEKKEKQEKKEKKEKKESKKSNAENKKPVSGEVDVSTEEREQTQKQVHEQKLERPVQRKERQGALYKLFRRKSI